MKKVKRGEICYADLSPVVSSEQDGTRPVLVIQNDTGNKFSPTTNERYMGDALLQKKFTTDTLPFRKEKESW